ncbi:argininosuccinate synthase [Lactobacillus sp. S2-2]|uniref:argininosuccinate synthase n=1 Tax=Lactobacillus sp. S2-2 TaxID=2692917 RepID=UPI001F01F21D|nr:argininosuccinate synthase [Lactobacillus sp. S2-2]MCF6515729.1 argininosuccinate synthase [Lactobacillus sp. S2-2]
MNENKVVLAYSGGLDTSVAIAWLKDKGYDVIACCINVGEGKNLTEIKDKAIKTGAIKAYSLDTLDEFANDFLSYTLKANATYENSYPLISALSRPLISKKLVEIAHQNNAQYIAHGCTGKGNDQVRFEVAINSLDPMINVLSPVRDWHWSREEEIKFAKDHQIEIPINLDSPYSIDENIWGRANECGVLEDPWNEAPEDAFANTKSIEDAKYNADIVEIEFKNGIPIKLNDNSDSFKNIIEQLNILGGQHGIGRIDHIENRLVGIKSREVYEAPGAMILLKAHEELENLTLEKDLGHFKTSIENKFSELIYNGLWFSPLMKSLKSFIDDSQQYVNGVIKLKLYKGNIWVLGRKSDNSLYDENLATYTSSDSFDQEASKGFIKIWGLPSQVSKQVEQKIKEKNFLKSLNQQPSKVKVESEKGEFYGKQ